MADKINWTWRSIFAVVLVCVIISSITLYALTPVFLGERHFAFSQLAPNTFKHFESLKVEEGEPMAFEEVSRIISPKVIEFDQHLEAVSGDDNRPIIPESFQLTHRLVNETVEGRRYTPYCLSNCHVLIEYQVSEGVTFDNYALKTKHLYNVQDITSSGIDVLIKVGERQEGVDRSCVRNEWLTINGSEAYEVDCSYSSYNTIDIMEWRSLDSVELKPGEKYYFDYWINKRAMLGNRKIDIVPEVYEAELPYAIVESDYVNKRELVLASSGTCVGQNCPVYLNITGLTLNTNNCSKELAITDASLNEVDRMILDAAGEDDGDGSEYCLVLFTTNKTTANVSFWAYYNSATGDSYAKNKPNFYNVVGGFADGTDDNGWDTQAGQSSATFTYNLDRYGHPTVTINSTSGDNRWQYYGGDGINPMNTSGGLNGSDWRSIMVGEFASAGASPGVRFILANDGAQGWIIDHPLGTTMDINNYGDTPADITFFGDGKLHILEHRRYGAQLEIMVDPHLQLQNSSWNLSAIISAGSGKQNIGEGRKGEGSNGYNFSVTSWGVTPTYTSFYVTAAIGEEEAATVTQLSIDFLNLNSSSNTNYTNEDWTIKNVNVSDNDSAYKLVYNWHNDNETYSLLNCPFETGSDGSLTADYSNYGNNGTVSGATWNATAGYDGFGGYEFDGVNDYLEFDGYNDKLNVTGSVTLSAWIKPVLVTAASGYQLVYCKRETTGTGYGFGLNNDEFVFSVNGTIQETTGSQVSLNEWQHFVAVFDDPNDIMRIYKNGVEIFNATETGTISPSAVNPRVGRCAFGNLFFNGTIDDVTIYNKVLNVSEINEIYHNNTWNLSSQSTLRTEIWEARTIAFDTTDASAIFKANMTIRNWIPTSPTNILPANFSTYNLSVVLNCTGANDTVDFDTVNYLYFVGNDSTNMTVWGTRPTTNNTFHLHGLTNNTYYAGCIATDSIDNSTGATPNMSWVVDNSILIKNTTTFSGTILSGSSATYSLNTTYNTLRSFSYINATLTYNYTTYNATKTSGSASELFENTLNTPVTTQNVVIPFWWNLTVVFTNGTSLDISYNTTQILTGYILTNCSEANLSSIAVLNFTYLTEPDGNTLNGTFKGTFILWSSDRNTNSSTSLIVHNTTHVLLCLNPPSKIFYTDAHIDYYSAGYDIRQYYFVNKTLNTTMSGNISTTFDTVDLYSLDIVLANGIGLTIQDQTGIGKPQVYIEAQRYDPGTNTYKLVAMGRTDQDGQDYIYLRKYDAFYRFILKQNNSILWTSDKMKITTDTLQLTVEDTYLKKFLQAFDNVEFDLSFDNTSKVYQVVYSTTDSTVTDACLKVTRFRTQGVEYICDTCQHSASATLTCDTGNVSGEYVAVFYVSANNNESRSQLASLDAIIPLYNTFRDTIHREGAVLSFILAGIIAFSGLWTPIAAVVFLMFAIIILSVLGLLKFGYITIIVLGIIAAFILARLKP